MTETLIGSPISVWRSPEPFVLESGEILPELTLAYRTWGPLAPSHNNVVWICHALTGSSDAADWWSGLVGPGRVIDTNRFHIVCVNMIGSCYGSTGPTFDDVRTGLPFCADFPLITIRDQVRAFDLLRQSLNIATINILIGGSMGGQQVLEWAALRPDVVRTIVPIATNAQHSPWAVAFNAAQRMALEADPTFFERRLDGGRRGMAAARAVAMLSYRTSVLYNYRQREDEDRPREGLRADRYQRYQGDKLIERFSPHAYHALSRTMDSHDIGRDRGGVGTVLRAVTARAVVVGISSDILFPEAEQHFIADQVRHGTYFRLTSPNGHDAFLLDQDKLDRILRTSRVFVTS